MFLIRALSHFALSRPQVFSRKWTSETTRRNAFANRDLTKLADAAKGTKYNTTNRENKNGGAFAAAFVRPRFRPVARRCTCPRPKQNHNNNLYNTLRFFFLPCPIILYCRCYCYVRLLSARGTEEEKKITIIVHTPRDNGFKHVLRACKCEPVRVACRHVFWGATRRGGRRKTRHGRGVATYLLPRAGKGRLARTRTNYNNSKYVKILTIYLHACTSEYIIRRLL